VAASLSEPLQGCSTGSVRRRPGKAWLFDVYLWHGKKASAIVHAVALSKAYELANELTQLYGSHRSLQSLINVANLVALADTYQVEPMNRPSDALLLSQNHLVSRVLYTATPNEVLPNIVSVQTVEVWQREDTLNLLDRGDRGGLSKLRRSSLRPAIPSKSTSQTLMLCETHAYAVYRNTSGWWN